MTQIIKTKKLNKNLLKNIVKILRSGGVVAFPTDTVYGIAALPNKRKAVNKLFKIKKRPSKKPIPILISSKNIFKKITKHHSNISNLLVKYFWPGALSIVIPKSELIPSFVTKGSKNIAVRIPNHIIALQIIKATGGILAVTSANISGKKAATSAAQLKKLKGIDLIIDGGRSKLGVASTVVSLSKNRIIILRQGSVKLLH